MKIGVMNHPAASVYEQIDTFGKSGFDFVDLTIEGPVAWDIESEKIRPILERHHLHITGHTDPCLPWAYPIGAVRQACLDELERCARIFAALGADIMNLHPCYACPPAMRPSLVDLNAAALPPIVEMAASYNLSLVLENFKPPFDRVATFKELFDKAPGLGLHLDFGHTNLGGDGHDIFCRHLGRHIRHVHFSDNRSQTDDHMPLGVGRIKWKGAVNALKAAGYDGTITLEVFCEDSRMLLRYLDLSRDYLRELWNEPVEP